MKKPKNNHKSPTTLVLHNNSNESNSSRARTRYIARWQAVFLKALKRGKFPNVTEACRAARINRTTAYRHRESDEQFDEKWTAVVDASIDKLEAKGFDMGLKGDPQMIQFYLKAHRGERYRETSRLEIDQRLVGVLVVPEKEKRDP